MTFNIIIDCNKHFLLMTTFIPINYSTTRTAFWKTKMIPIYILSSNTFSFVMIIVTTTETSISREITTATTSTSISTTTTTISTSTFTSPTAPRPTTTRKGNRFHRWRTTSNRNNQML